MITADLRGLIRRYGAEPLLRPGAGPGEYVCRVPDAEGLADGLSREPWVAAARSRAGYLTVTVTHEALANVAVRVAQAGPACTGSDALRGRTLTAPRLAPVAAAPGWPQARAALAAGVTGRLAAAAGATVLIYPECQVVPGPGSGAPADAVAYAGEDAVRFALARMAPGERAGSGPDPVVIARHVLGNPAYAVRYAHAAAVAVLRWAAELGLEAAGYRPRLLAEPRELALLDALSWLPERVAIAARRSRPDEFARYLETLATRTIDVLSTTAFRVTPELSTERLWLADAARTGLAAGLDLLGITAPRRL